MPSHRHPARQEPEIPPEQYIWTENRNGEEVSIMVERARFGGRLGILGIDESRR
jgi:hypothetical protein